MMQHQYVKIDDMVEYEVRKMKSNWKLRNANGLYLLVGLIIGLSIGAVSNHQVGTYATSGTDIIDTRTGQIIWYADKFTTSDHHGGMKTIYQWRKAGVYPKPALTCPPKRDEGEDDEMDD